MQLWENPCEVCTSVLIVFIKHKTQCRAQGTESDGEIHRERERERGRSNPQTINPKP